MCKFQGTAIFVHIPQNKEFIHILFPLFLKEAMTIKSQLFGFYDNYSIMILS